MTKQLLTGAPPTELRRPMSYAEYLALLSEGPLVEWVNGEAVFHNLPTTLHQEIVGFLTTLLGVYADFFGLGQVYLAPLEMRCGPDGPSREPDILFVATANVERIGEKRIEGPADLVIEVVSDDSVVRDFDDKFIEYQDCGVQEYWIVDPRPRRQRALFYQRSVDGLLESLNPETGGIYRSKVMPGFWLKVDWMWELPDALLTFAEIAGFSERTQAELREKKRGG